MAKTSAEKLFASLRDLHKERRRLIRRLTREGKMAHGTVSVIHRKCGSPNCRCAQGPGHPQMLFLFKDQKEGRRRCKLVRRADESWMLQAGQRYKEFRDGLRELRAIDSEEKRILLALAALRSIEYE